MTTHHRSPTYQANARIIRKATNAAHQRGEPVPCIGCGHDIQPGQTFDIGHRIDASRGGPDTLDNLGPQHRRENRQAGGRLGAHHTNTTRRTTRRARGLPTW